MHVCKASEHIHVHHRTDFFHRISDIYWISYNNCAYTIECISIILFLDVCLLGFYTCSPCVCVCVCVYVCLQYPYVYHLKHEDSTVICCVTSSYILLLCIVFFI